MKKTLSLVLLMLFPFVSVAAERGSVNARVGVGRASQAAARMPTATTNMGLPVNSGASTASSGTNNISSNVSAGGVSNTTGKETIPDVAKPVEEVVEEKTDCRTAYRDCMDQFCLLDESEGARCACSSTIEASKSLILEIQEIQAEADKLYTEGVEREQLGAKAKLVFGESEQAKQSSAKTGISFTAWLNSGLYEETGSVGEDSDIGDNLYAMATEFCAAELESCADKAEMEEVLYSRQIVQDCKNFETYLKDQKANAESNKRIAESAVRKARLEMLDTTNKYNRGECLLAYKACIADKGGCGTNFENCLDADLLGRRANACENVLDQCMAVREQVLEDWEAESEMVLAEAAKYADKYKRNTCTAKIQLCLEDSCSTSTNSTCLSDINIAAGICPIIDECNDLVPGLKDSVAADLALLRTQFCQNDIDSCLRDKCGENFSAPECIGKKTSEIVALCPQSMFPSCKTETQFDIIVQSVLLQMDYKMMQGCVNYFSEQLGKVCGTDMSCLPTDTAITSLTRAPETQEELTALKEKIKANSKQAVEDFFKRFEQDITVAACQDSQKPAGQKSLGQNVFNTARQIAEVGAENRALRELDQKILELTEIKSVEDAEQYCYKNYPVETPDKSSSNYSYIKSVTFEPSLRNCHVCRVQQVCEIGGETKAAAAMKGVAGGLSSGAAMGTMVSPGWGTAIGGAVGAVGMGLLAGLGSSGQQEFCQEIESCEDINVSDKKANVAVSSDKTNITMMSTKQ